jgi:hypothetical protein
MKIPRKASFLKEGINTPTPSKISTIPAKTLIKVSGRKSGISGKYISGVMKCATPPKIKNRAKIIAMIFFASFT